jgi:hypothetical protein
MLSPSMKYREEPGDTSELRSVITPRCRRNARVVVLPGRSEKANYLIPIIDVEGEVL